jgi:hypothetical protein
MIQTRLLKESIDAIDYGMSKGSLIVFQLALEERQLCYKI